MSKFITKFVTGLSTVAMATSMLIMPATTFAATAGEVYKATDGTVYFIDSSMQKRAFTSWGAFESYGFLSAGQIQNMTDAVMALPSGALVAPQDGRIFCATATKDSDVKGECSLITGGKKAAFTSAAVFGAQGFSFANAYNGDSSFLTKTANIDNGSAAHSAGVLVNNGGTIQLVVSGGLWGTPSMDVFNSWGWKMSDVVTANAADKALTQTGVIAARTAGQLSPSAATTPVDNGEITGEGSVKDFSVGSAEETTVSEDMSDVELVSFDVELEDDGSLGFDRFDLYMGQDNTVTASNKPWDYFTDATLMVNGDEVASMDVDSSADWSEYDAGTLGTTSQEYRLRFSGLDSVLANDETSTVSVAFSTASTIDSADEDAVWQFGTETDSFRFTDGTGFVFTDGEDLADSFAFDTAEEAALEISANTDDIDAQVVEVNDTTDTNGVELGIFDIEETEDVDVNITEMEVVLATSDTITDVVKTLYLYDGADKIGQETVTGLTVTFDNIDFDVAAGDTVTLTIKADLDDTNTQVRYQDGDTVEVDDVNITAFTDDFDNDENDITPSGTYASETHALYVNGIRVEFVSDSTTAEKTFTADASGEDDQGTYTITFDVTAFGADAYIDRSTEDDNGGFVAGEGIVYDINSTAGTPTVSSALLEAEGTESGDHAVSFMVPEGETRTFTLTVILTADTTPTDGSHQVILESVNWDLQAGGTDATPDYLYNFDMGDYKTPYLFLNGIA